MSYETTLPDIWTRTNDGRGHISPVNATPVRRGKHDTRVWQYESDAWAVACTGCGFNLAPTDEDTARHAADHHHEPGYTRPHTSEILWTSKGHEVETRMGDEAAAELLKTKWVAENNDFAGDLAKGFVEYGSWTDKQRPWAHLLANEWQDKQQGAADSADVESAGNDGPTFPRIVAMMVAAASELKYPKVRLADDADNVVRLSVAGGRARYPGSVNVTTDESYSSNTWFGRIMLDGTWTPSNRCPEWVTNALTQFEADPEASARAYGQRFAHCCFCGRELIESGSVDVGYGPVCAEHWGLPHPQH